MRNILFGLISFCLSSNTFAIGQVLHFLAGENENKLVINLGKKDGVYPGDIFISYRKSGENEVRTGKIKVESSANSQSIAEIIGEGGSTTQAIFPEYQKIMAKDILRKPAIVLAHRQDILKDIEINYFSIFSDPNANPETFELTEEGKEILRKEFENIAHRHYKYLIVKAFTDRKGSFEANQIESYQRALTIKQFLEQEFALENEKVVAVGLGESELKNDSNVSGSHIDNRRIVLKIAADMHF